MIKRLQRKFILTSTAALAVVLLTIVGSIIAISYTRAVQEVRSVMTVLAQNNGELSSEVAGHDARQQFGPHFNREGLFQYRYFSVLYDRQQRIKGINDNNIKTVSPTAITSLANRAVKAKRSAGIMRYQYTTYAYRVIKKQRGQTLVIFLDQSIIMNRTNEIINTGLLLGLIGLILFTLVLIFFSRRAIKPVVQAEKRQREFITNAGHELKTPLAIISANNELQEMMNGPSEWTKSNKQQIHRLTRLINRLVSLARLEEQPTMEPVDFNASQIAEKAADEFKPVIQQEKKQFSSHISPDIFTHADKNYFFELVNILLDNANKYCDANGKVSLALTKGKYGRHLYLQVGNDYADGKGIDYQKFFDRFYRHDLSHNQEKRAGFGIGLSMAQNIIENFKGKLTVKYQTGRIYFTVRLRLTAKPKQ